MPSFQVSTEYSRLTEVSPGLFVSGVTALNNPSALEALGVRLIVNATREVPNLRDGAFGRLKLWLEDVDEAEILGQLDVVVDQMERVLSDGDKVLVHCVAGVSRSAAVCLAYLVKYRARSLRDAYLAMAKSRPLVRPNLGFWRQLILYERLVKNGRSSVRIVNSLLTSEQDGTVVEFQRIPDVYLPNVLPQISSDEKENAFVLEGRQRKFSGQKPKFIPVLETLVEIEP